MGDERDIVTDQERARIERAEVEARREAVKEYADERREEAKHEQLEQLRNGNDTDGPPGFFEWVGGGLRRFAAGLKKVDEQMLEAHSSDDDEERTLPALDGGREPQMPDPFDDGEDTNQRRDWP